MTGSRLHAVILRCAALLAPRLRRSDWLAEWHAELLQVRRQAPARATAFCLGAPKDAFWLWREEPLSEEGMLFAQSPLACICWLAVLAVGCLSAALLLPASRTALLSGMSAAHTERDPFTAVLTTSTASFLFACALQRVMNLSSPDRRLRRIGPQRGLFLAAKALLLLPAIVLGSLALGSSGGAVSPVSFDIALFASMFAARWMFADQRHRCPVCLRLLANPVRIGEASRMLLESHGTERICLRGHGMLYTPEWPAIWPIRQQWMTLGASWSGLFR